MALAKFSSKPGLRKQEEAFLNSAAMAVQVSTAEPTTPADSPPTAKPKDGDTSVYKSIAVRLNKRRYQELKMLSTVTETSLQTLITEAIDALLKEEATQKS